MGKENLATGISITTEEPHDHECWVCGGVWEHTDDLCEGIAEVTCPACEE
jgi:hypothetical protein